MHSVRLSNFCNRWYQIEGAAAACTAGVMATSHISPGDTLMRVPMGLVLSEANLAAEAPLEWSLIRELPHSTRLALLLIHEMKKKNSWRGAYLDVLPKECRHCYSQWSVEQRRELQGLDNTLVWGGSEDNASMSSRDDYHRFEVTHLSGSLSASPRDTRR